MSLGAGLLAERLGGVLLPERLVMPLGVAFLVLLGALALSNSLTARVTTPVLLVAAAAGYFVPLEGRRRRPSLAVLAPALVVFAFYAAPTVMPGSATLLGFGKLDDPATFFGLLQRVEAHGYSLHGLPVSSYRQTLSLFFHQGYPLGVFAPFGAGAKVVGQDLPWIFQPYIAFLAGMVALVLAEIGRKLMGAKTAAVAAVGASLSALLYGYAMWGGVKELSGAMLLALGAALVPIAVAHAPRLRAAVPLAFVSAAMIDGLTVGALIWVGPLLAAAVVGWWFGRTERVPGPESSVAAKESGSRVPRRRAVAATALGALLLVPASSFTGSKHITVSGGTRLGTLPGPLKWEQILGIWPSRDFRFEPHQMTMTWVMVAVVGVAAVVGLAAAWRAGRWELPVLVGTALIGAVVLEEFASPWMSAKGLAIASPALLMAAFAGVVAAWRGMWPLVRWKAVRRVGGVLAGGLIGVGVLWSVALAYQGVTPAPRERLLELGEIDKLIAGEGPTLTTEYSSYADRYYLRDAAPEGPSEIRSRPIELRDGTTLPKDTYADLDEFKLRAVMVYRTIVMRRSPVSSRPPSVYRRIWTGRDYEVWQRPRDASNRVIAHLSLGNEDAPAAVPKCAQVMALAAKAKRVGGTLVAFRRTNPPLALAAISHHPTAWDGDGSLSNLIPTTAGTLHLPLRVPRAGRYRLWLGGSLDRGFSASVDGRPLGSVTYEINPPGYYSSAKALTLKAGTHRVTLSRGAADLYSGSASGQPLTSVVLAPVHVDSRLIGADPRAVDDLCAQQFDWVEAVHP